MTDTLVVVSKIKKMVRQSGFRTGGDYIQGLSKKVDEMIKASVEKVKVDGKKKTLGLEDL